MKSTVSCDDSSEYNEEEIEGLYNQLYAEAEQEAADELRRNGKKVTMFVLKSLSRWVVLTEDKMEQKIANADPKTSENLRKYLKHIEEEMQNTSSNRVGVVADQQHVGESSDVDSDSDYDEETMEEHKKKFDELFAQGKSAEYIAELTRNKFLGIKQK